MSPRTILIPPLYPAERLDKALTRLLADPALSRARLQALIKEGRVQKDGRVVTATDCLVESGQSFSLDLPPPTSAKPRAQKISLNIVYEDADLLVVDKPAGMVVHPAAGNPEGTLVNALLSHCGKSLSGIGGVARPGIVHRLDKETSGLMVVAKNDLAHNALAAQFADRTLGRLYRALVWGLPSPLEGEIEGAIGRSNRDRKKMTVTPGGKPSLTFYEVEESFGTMAALVQCRLATGRTHQIRVHMAHIGHPVVGDPLYGRKRKTPGAVAELESFPRQALHAFEIHFKHPRTGKTLRFKAALPEDFAALLKSLKKRNKQKP